MNNLFGYDHFSSIEKRTFEKSLKQYPGFEKDMPSLIDLLCKLRYFFGKPTPSDLEKDDGSEISDELIIGIPLLTFSLRF